MDKFKALKIIVRIGAGYDNIDIKAAAEMGLLLFLRVIDVSAQKIISAKLKD